MKLILTPTAIRLFAARPESQGNATGENGRRASPR